MPLELPRCGRISYTNDLPVYTAIDEGVLAFPGTLEAGVPSELNHALLDGQLDISPISSALYAQHADKLILLPNVCVAAKDAVRSIYCISARDPATLGGTKIAVTKESLTACTLLRVICRTWYRFDPDMVESDDPLESYLHDGSPCLLIGDKAVDASETVPQANLFDLGSLWRKLSGYGMVFALWAVRDEYARSAAEETRAVATALSMSLQWGLENIEHVIRRAQTVHPHREGFYAEYYRALDFRLDGDACEALAAFFTRGKEAGVFSQAPPLNFFDMVPAHV